MTVSSTHAEIHFSEQSKQFVLKDLGSSNGTYIQYSSIILENGMIIECGDLQLVCIIQDTDVLVLKVVDCLYPNPEVLGYKIEFDFKKKQLYTIGSKFDADFSKDNVRLEKEHAEVRKTSNRFTLTAKAITWRKLSPTSIPSADFLLPPFDNPNQATFTVRFGDIPCLFTLE
eukprot:TRINITY_DN5764_c0_g1_i1.p1 TRINITY_DN5764_c0_g1~~TRINITY_DN5764_c0_g1_i1.p1  ORF type:complete len:172 (-),score=17.37 TRINITY_DN5764_c0_g1_i1:130-645(-)